MIVSLTLATPGKEKFLLIFLFLIGLTAGIYTFPLSYVLNTNFLIGLCLFPFCIFINGGQRNNYRYILMMVLFGSLALRYTVHIFYFFTLAFYVLWLIELFIGKSNPLILFLLVFMSPVFYQLTTILGFPVRIMLSSVAGTVLQSLGMDLQVEGNMMQLNGASFTVDEACMGLNMLAMSMLMGCFIMAHRYRASGKESGLFQLLVFFVMVFVLNVSNNLLRIVVLVLFRIPPENSMHEVIGLLCLIGYVLIPVYFLSGRMIAGKQRDVYTKPGQFTHSLRSKSMLFLFPVIILVIGVLLKNNKSKTVNSYATVTTQDLKAERLNDGITKITGDELLIYVKPIREFFSGEHTPLICWKGSGYDFKSIREISVEGCTIYCGKLVKKNEELHTAWWYANGNVNTISQLDWRLRMLKGENKFCVVNVTAKDEETLRSTIASIIKANTLRIQH